MYEIDIWKFIAGLGIFLLGMERVETSLAELAGRSFKVFLRKYTKNRFLALVNGAVATAFLQSSSVVTLMVLAFVGSGVLTLSHALGIVLGANLGTTFTGWVVATLGFKADIAQFILPLIGLGGCGMVFLGPRFRFYYYLGFFVGLGFLFMGLDYMKTSMEVFVQSTDISFLKGWGLAAFLVFGVSFTALIQSSSASMIIALTALNAEAVQLYEAAAFVVGADLGTTATILLGAIGGNLAKKRVALAHFLFNLVTDAIAFILIAPLFALIQTGFGVINPLYALVTFHSSFNLVGILVFSPFLKLFERVLNRLILDRNDERACHFVHQVDVAVPDAALKAVREELVLLNRKVFEFQSQLLGLELPFVKKPESGALFNLFVIDEKGRNKYQEIKKVEGELIDYLRQLQRQAIDKEDAAYLHQYILALRYNIQAAKAVKDIQHNLEDFNQSLSQEVLNLKVEISQHYGKLHGEILLVLEASLGEASNIHIKLEQLNQLFIENERAYKNVNEWIYHQTFHNREEENAVATFLNVNREIFSSNRYFLQALKDTFLPPEVSTDFSSLPRT